MSLGIDFEDYVRRIINSIISEWKQSPFSCKTEIKLDEFLGIKDIKRKDDKGKLTGSEPDGTLIFEYEKQKIALIWDAKDFNTPIQKTDPKKLLGDRKAREDAIEKFYEQQKNNSELLSKEIDGFQIKFTRVVLIISQPSELNKGAQEIVDENMIEIIKLSWKNNQSCNKNQDKELITRGFLRIFNQTLQSQNYENIQELQERQNKIRSLQDEILLKLSKLNGLYNERININQINENNSHGQILKYLYKECQKDYKNDIKSLIKQFKNFDTYYVDEEEKDQQQQQLILNNEIVLNIKQQTTNNIQYELGNRQREINNQDSIQQLLQIEQKQIVVVSEQVIKPSRNLKEENEEGDDDEYKQDNQQNEREDEEDGDNSNEQQQQQQQKKVIEEEKQKNYIYISKIQYKNYSQ